MHLTKSRQVISRPVGQKETMKSIRTKVTPQLFQTEIAATMQNGSTRFTLWFYPETKESKKKKITDHFQEYLLGREAVQPVTLYGDKEPKPVESEPLIYRLTPGSIEKMMGQYKEITASCDSVATYLGKNPTFVWAVAFHENEIFLQEVDAMSNQALRP